MEKEKEKEREGEEEEEEEEGREEMTKKAATLVSRCGLHFLSPSSSTLPTKPAPSARGPSWVAAWERRRKTQAGNRDRRKKGEDVGKFATPQSQEEPCCVALPLFPKGSLARSNLPTLGIDR